ncbi:hypothetical protein [Psychrobacillus sp. NPDC093180]|uniref:hypothetical protein n=1 Tax=Psychrobacillus sp. NPDC093180 TaxID=3364489 RepID=UPI0037F99BB0
MKGKMVAKIEKVVAEIDLRENGIYTVRDGRLEKIEKLPHGFGKVTIVIENDKPTRYDTQYSKRLG